ncbi:uncharacterized protein, partial [Diadema antillarum]|uniref:uncharacterized protein n=1 Tax=Diadema antillarum TaxID=105358 RepID=UPI003A85E388
MATSGSSLAFSLRLCLLVILSISFASGSQWYEGCYWSSITSPSLGQYIVNEDVTATPASCCAHCYNDGFDYAALGNGSCWCGTSTSPGLEAPESACNTTCFVESSYLPCGGGMEAMSVYSTLGPYILTVSLSKGSTTVQTGTTSLFDARIELAGSVNTSTGLALGINENEELQDAVNVTWSINGVVLKHTMAAITNTSAAANFLHTFNQVGSWSVEVTVTNAVSRVHVATTLHVVQPIPSDLQVILRPGQGNIPSCVPEHDSLSSNLPVVAVFVNEESEFQAYLSIGVNLTFDWWFSEDGSHVTSTPYLENEESCDGNMCLHSHQ